MRSRCATGIFHRSAVFSSRICFLVHLTIRPPESDSHSESYRASGRETEKYRKPLDSISYGSGIRLSYSSIVKLPFVCLVAHDRKLHRWTTAVNVKRLLPPRQSRGPPLGVSLSDVGFRS